MKRLLIVLTVLFAVLGSTPSHAEWKEVARSTDNDVAYVDFERIRKVDGYVYYWSLMDSAKPTEQGDLSFKAYRQADCKLFRVKNLSFSFYKEPMAEGAAGTFTPSDEWTYVEPETVDETALTAVCEAAK